MSFSFIRWSFCLAALAVGSLHAAELPIISKARAFLGSEASLNSIRSIHYTGTLVTVDPVDATKQTRAAVEIIMVKPDRQRVTIKSDTTIETTALDGYDGWSRITAVADRTKWKQSVLSADQIKRLRANTWESIGFFRGLEQAGGEVHDLGKVTMDDKACEKVSFVHTPEIIFTRYFDLATGRLVLTETESGSIKEQGEMIVDGVRFPKAIVTTYKNPTGQAMSVTITFEKIALNEAFGNEVFAVPSLLNR